jgi:hypothetical protein
MAGDRMAGGNGTQILIYLKIICEFVNHTFRNYLRLNISSD